jgi:hypothetical protein
MKNPCARRALAGSILLMNLAATAEVRAGVAPPPFASVQVNDPLDDGATNNTQSDTALTLGAPGTVLVAYIDSGSYAAGSSFRFTGWARSTDDGATFADLGALSSNGNNNDFGFPHLVRNVVSGRVYASTMGFNTNAVRVFRSDDDGQSWLAAVDVMPGPCDSSCDLPTIAVDNVAGATQGYVYAAARDFGAGPGIYLSRSTDHGATWSGGTQVEATGGLNVQSPELAVGADHMVHLAYYDSSPLSVRLKRSTDFGATFSAAVQIAPILSTGINGDLGLGFRTNTFPKLVANPAAANELFAAFADNPAGADRGNIYLTRSTDFGTTWSASQPVNDDAGTNDQFVPALAISPDGTRLFVGWYDRRDDAGNVMIRYYGRLARLGGAPVFAPAFPLSDGMWTPCHGTDPAVNSTFLTDFDRTGADSSYFYSAFLDCGAGDANVRLARIPIDHLFRDGFETSGSELWSYTSP